jgi:chromosome segregation ATPase
MRDWCCSFIYVQFHIHTCVHAATCTGVAYIHTHTQHTYIHACIIHTYIHTYTLGSLILNSTSSNKVDMTLHPSASDTHEHPSPLDTVIKLSQQHRSESSHAFEHDNTLAGELKKHGILARILSIAVVAAYKFDAMDSDSDSDCSGINESHSEQNRSRGAKTGRGKGRGSVDHSRESNYRSPAQHHDRHVDTTHVSITRTPQCESLLGAEDCTDQKTMSRISELESLLEAARSDADGYAKELGEGDVERDLMHSQVLSLRAQLDAANVDGQTREKHIRECLTQSIRSVLAQIGQLENELIAVRRDAEGYADELAALEARCGCLTVQIREVTGELCAVRAACESETIALNARIHTLSEELSVIKKVREEEDSDSDARARKESDTLQELESAKGECDALRRTLDSLNAQVVDLTERLRHREETFNDSVKECEVLRAEVQQAQLVLQSMREQLTTKEDEVRALESRIDALKREPQDSETATGSHQQELVAREQARDALQRELEDAQSVIKSHEYELAAREQARDALQREYECVVDACERQKEVISTQQRESDELKRELDAVTHACESHKQQIQAHQHEVSDLKRLHDEAIQRTSNKASARDQSERKSKGGYATAQCPDLSRTDHESSARNDSGQRDQGSSHATAKCLDLSRNDHEEIECVRGDVHASESQGGLETDAIITGLTTDRGVLIPSRSSDSDSEPDIAATEDVVTALRGEVHALKVLVETQNQEMMVKNEELRARTCDLEAVVREKHDLTVDLTTCKQEMVKKEGECDTCMRRVTELEALLLADKDKMAGNHRKYVDQLARKDEVISMYVRQVRDMEDLLAAERDEFECKNELLEAYKGQVDELKAQLVTEREHADRAGVHDRDHASTQGEQRTGDTPIKGDVESLGHSHDNDFAKERTLALSQDGHLTGSTLVKEDEEVLRQTNSALVQEKDALTLEVERLMQECAMLKQQGMALTTLVHDKDALTLEIARLTQECAMLKQGNMALAQGHETLVHEKDALTVEVARLAQEVENVKQTNSTLTQEKDALTHEKDALTVEVARLAHVVESVEQTNITLAKDKDTFVLEMGTLAHEIENLKHGNSTLAKENETFVLEVGSLAQEIEDLKHKNSTLAQENGTFVLEMGALAQEIENLKHTGPCNNLAEEKDAPTVEDDTLIEKLQLLEQSNIALAQEKGILASQVEALKEENRSLVVENDTLDIEMHTLMQETEALGHKLVTFAQENEAVMQQTRGILEEKEKISHEFHNLARQNDMIQQRMARTALADADVWKYVWACDSFDQLFLCVSHAVKRTLGADACAFYVICDTDRNNAHEKIEAGAMAEDGHVHVAHRHACDDDDDDAGKSHNNQNVPPMQHAAQNVPPMQHAAQNVPPMQHAAHLVLRTVFIPTAELLAVMEGQSAHFNMQDPHTHTHLRGILGVSNHAQSAQNIQFGHDSDMYTHLEGVLGGFGQCMDLVLPEASLLAHAVRQKGSPVLCKSPLQDETFDQEVCI